MDLEPHDEPGHDKRRAKRIQRRFVLRAAVFSKEPLAWSHVTVKNLSASGILFNFDRPVEVGQNLVFKINFPDRIIECGGRAVRVERGPGGLFSNVAAQFHGLNDLEREYIEAFVENWHPDQK